MMNTHWIGGLNGSRVGHIYWADDGNGVGEVSLGLSDGSTLRFDTTPSESGANSVDLWIKGVEHDSNQPVGHFSSRLSL